MKIPRLRLKGYKRFLAHIDEFIYRPVSQTQFITGTNGSGKSSLIEQLSPEPPDKADFQPDGEKEIDIILGGDRYEIATRFSAEHTHSFKKNGEELNEGGTARVQKELVEKHLRYTADVSELARGTIYFTSMRPPERKRWFTMLADANYDYAIGVFNRVKAKERDVVGAIKVAKKRLVIESAKVMKNEDFEVLESERNKLYEAIQKLIEIRSPKEHDIDSVMGEAGSIADSIHKSADTIGNIIRSLGSRHYGDEQAVLAIISRLSSEIGSLQGKSDAHLQEYEKSKELSESWKQSKLHDLAQLNKQIVDAERQIQEGQNKIILDFERVTDSNTIIESIKSCLVQLPHLVPNLHDNRIFGYKKSLWDEKTKQLEELQNAKQQLRTAYDRSNQLIDYQRQHQHESSVDCPRCSFSFQPVFDPAKLESFQKAASDASAGMVKKDAEIAELSKELEKINNYFDNYRATLQLIRNAPGLEPVANLMVRDQIIVNTPDKIADILSLAEQQARHWIQMDALYEQVDKTRELISKTHGADVQSLESIERRRMELEAIVGDIEQKKLAMIVQKNDVENYLTSIRELEREKSKLLELQDHYQEIQDIAFETIRREQFNNFLNHLQSKAAQLENTLAQARQQKSVIIDIENQIAALSQEQQELATLLKALSPNEGLIAEGIFAFMKAFVEEMNKIIRLIWTYPLEIKPCKSDGGDNVSLNYLFPMMVDGKPRKDVSEGSGAMREIINLAFRIAAMKALKIGDYPIFLDEFGKEFDNAHKKATIGLLNAIIELDNFEQIFMISHDVVQYGSLGKAEILLLHESNVAMPVNCVVNKHVTMI